jgi:hypothetical protein
MYRWRKILLIIFFLLLMVAIGYAIYAIFFRAVISPGGIQSPGQQGGGGLPIANEGVPGSGTNINGGFGGIGEGLPPASTASEIASGGLTQADTLVPTVTSDPQLAADGKSLYYYDRATGQYFKIDPKTGTSTPLTDKIFPGVQATSWAPTGDAKAILQFPDNRKIFFDFDKQAQVTLPSHWEDFSWATNGNEIAAKSLGASENNRFLILANPDGSNARPIAELGRNEGLVTVNYSPNNDVVAFSRTGQARPLGEQEIIPIGKNKENFRGLVVQGLGVQTVWSPDGARILYSAANAASDWKPALWVVNGRGDGIGSDRKSIGLLTWADKCGFVSATVAYCAAPRELPTGAGFGRGIANNTPDDLYRVDLATGQFRLVATPEDPAAISKVLVAKDGSTLYYTELQSGALREIRLR